MNFQHEIGKLLSPCSTEPSLKDRQAIAYTRAGIVKTVTYHQLEEIVLRAQAALATTGVQPGDTVVACSANSAELVATLFAAWALGALAIPVDYRVTPAELANITEAVSARALFLADDAREISASLPIIEAGTLADLQPAERTTCRHKPDTPALAILTSGSTGRPKAAVHDLGSLLQNVLELSEIFKLSRDTSALLPLPVSHIFGLEVLLATLCAGGTVIFSGFRGEEFIEQIRRFRPTFVVGVPTIYSIITAAEALPEELKSVETYLSGGAPLPESLAQEFKSKTGRQIIQGYGLTETKIVTVNLAGPVLSIGQPVPSATIEILSTAGTAVGDRWQGEIVVSGPMLMKGYLGQTEETAKSLRGGRFFTGDIGYMENGNLYISGRSKELIIVAGTNVFPFDVESVLRQHPQVHEVAIVGVPHTRLGQAVKAVVVVGPGPLSEGLCAGGQQLRRAESELKADLRRFCRDKLKREMQPMLWEFRPVSCPLPKTLTGKIDKKQLASTTT